MTPIGLSLLGLMMQPPGNGDWLAVNFFWTDAGATMIHDPVSGVLITASSSEECGGAKDEQSRIRETSEGQDGAYRWQVVELGDPAHDAETLVREVSPDKPPVPGSWFDEFIQAHTPPASCSREVEYRIRRPDGYCTTLKAVPCSSEQRERLNVYSRNYILGRYPVPFDDQSLKPSRSIVPADLDLLVPGLSANQVLEEFGLPRGFWPRWPDAFSWQYYAADALGVDVVVIDFTKDRKVLEVRLLKMAWE